MHCVVPSSSSDSASSWTCRRANSLDVPTWATCGALLARIAPWVPVKQLDLIFRTVFSEAHLDGNDGLETLAERAGDVFAHRADAVPSGLALKLIESARDATPLRRAGFTSRHLVHILSYQGMKSRFVVHQLKTVHE